MPKPKLIFTALLLFTIASGLWAVTYAAVPHLINYQGRLTDKDSKPLDGAHNLAFRIYDAETAGNLLWEETHQGVVIQKGIFSILIGSVKNLDLAFDKPYFLEIEVAGDKGVKEVMSPRQRITSAGYAIRAEKAETSDSAEKLSGKPLNDFVQTGQAAGGDLTNSYPNPAIAAGVVSQSKLKTAVGEESGAPGIEHFIVLPGGEYGFYPQFKTAQPQPFWATFWASNYEGRDFAFTTYTTVVNFQARDATAYVRQRYVTASGKDHWIFLLVDRNTKEIISAYSAPDHPAYGNGGDFEKMPNPFRNYDAAKHEIALLDKATVSQLKQESEAAGKSILTLINEEYRLNIDKEGIYQPLHSGKYLTKDGKQVMEMVEKLPEYIEVRRLSKLTAKEKEDKKLSMQAKMREIEKEKQKEIGDRQKAINKLQELGLTQSEIGALIKL